MSETPIDRIRKQIERREERRMFYHVTDKRFVSSIMKEGLKPQRQYDKPGILTNLWKNYEDALKYGKEWFVTNYAIVRVLIPLDMKILIFPQEELTSPWDSEYAVSEIIPPELLKVVMTWKETEIPTTRRYESYGYSLMKKHSKTR